MASSPNSYPGRLPDSDSRYPRCWGRRKERAVAPNAVMSKPAIRSAPMPGSRGRMDAVMMNATLAVIVPTRRAMASSAAASPMAAPSARATRPTKKTRDEDDREGHEHEQRQAHQRHEEAVGSARRCHV